MIQQKYKMIFEIKHHVQYASSVLCIALLLVAMKLWPIWLPTTILEKKNMLQSRLVKDGFLAWLLIDWLYGAIQSEGMFENS